ncbi:MAG: YfiR family protein [Verrucomicrobiota bacterium]|jgi:hypothetical protein
MPFCWPFIPKSCLRFAGWLVALPLLAFAQEKIELSPIEFKLTFLAKIPAYVTWPEPRSQVVIGILGKDPFDGLLSALVKDKKIDGREIQVKVFESPEAITECDILFVPAEQLAAWEDFSKSRDPRGLLTISEKKEFLSKGGIISLSVEDRKLDINLQNAKKAGLEINSKLVRMSRIVAR